jgi:hypothetical protein
MHEELLVYAHLLSVGITSLSEYCEYIGELFMKTPDNSLLLDLEWHSSDIQKTISEIRGICSGKAINYDVFGQFLISKLKGIYFENRMSIQDFCTKAYAIWNQLPDEINQAEPFFSLCYADDPLSYGDEKQTRDIYEKMFCFYDKI